MRLVRLRFVPHTFNDKWRKLVQEASKFGVIGAINTVLNYAVFNLLIFTVFATGQLKANVVATVIATTSSYFMNRHWTYRDRPKSALRREYVLFFLFNLAGMSIELGVLALAKYGLGITSPLALNLAKALAMVLGMVFRFWAYRTVVFRAAPAFPTPEPAPETEPAPGAAVEPAVAELAPGRPEAEFHQLTGELEVELDPPLDPAISAELDAAALGVNRTTRARK